MIKLLPARIVALAAALSCMQGAAVEPQDPYRQALLIGVWDYTNTTKLGALTTDLDALGTALQDSLKFDRVNKLPNPTWADLEIALSEATVVAQQHRQERGVLTVVYFAGHGTMVGNTSYLLTKDYLQPTVASELIVSGGIRVDYIAERFKPVGEPVVVIVGTCRNSFTPALTVNASASPPAEPPDFPRMIGPPSPFFGFAAWYAQKPGELIEITNPDPSVPTPFVRAFIDALPSGYELSGLAAAVKRRVKEATKTQTHPMDPYVLDDGGGEILLAYKDSDREADRNAWETAVATGRPDLVRDFAARFPTSRYTVIARDWLAQHQNVGAAMPTFVTYTYDLRGTLGAGTLEQIAGTIDNWSPRSIDVMAGAHIESASGPRKEVAFKEVRAMRRLPGDVVKFEAALQSNEIVELIGAQAKADPSRLVEFWNDPLAVGLTCHVDEIMEGRCALIEASIDLFRKSPVEKIGTLFIAGIAGGDGEEFEPAKNHRTLVAIAERFAAVGVPPDAFAFRSFRRSELPSAPAANLIKRGDGGPWPQ